MSCKIYLSTDDNAPVVAGNDRTGIINLLQKCLIDGYGSRNPAGGWTMPYRNTAGDIAVFRNSPEGTGHYLQINQSSAVSSSPSRYNAIGAEMASSEGDLQNTFERPNAILQSSNTNNATTRPWIVLANQYWVLLMVYIQQTGGTPTREQLASNGQTYGFWFGDYEKTFADDAYNSMLSPLYTYTDFGSTSSSSTSSSSLSSYYFSRKSGGAVGSVQGSAYLPHPCIGQAFGAGNSPAYSAQTGLYVSKVSLGGGEAYTLRGWLPDALCPLHLHPFEQLEQIEINGTNYTAVCFAQGYHFSTQYLCQLLFEVES